MTCLKNYRQLWALCSFDGELSRSLSAFVFCFSVTVRCSNIWSLQQQYATNNWNTTLVGVVLLPPLFIHSCCYWYCICIVYGKRGSNLGRKFLFSLAAMPASGVAFILFSKRDRDTTWRECKNVNIKSKHKLRFKYSCGYYFVVVVFQVWLYWESGVFFCLVGWLTGWLVMIQWLLSNITQRSVE